LLVKIEYDGAHNFDYDSTLEDLAGRARYSSDMDFTVMRRSITFEFSLEQRQKMFIAAVQSHYPSFSITAG